MAVQFVNRRFTKGVPFLLKMVHRRVPPGYPIAASHELFRQLITKTKNPLEPNICVNKGRIKVKKATAKTDQTTSKRLRYTIFRLANTSILQ